MIPELPGACREEGADLAPHPSTSPCKLGRDGRQWSDGRSGNFSLIEKMLRDGVIYKTISEKTGLSISTIEREAKHFGVSRRLPNWAPEKDAVLTELWSTPLTTRKIADKMRISTGSVIGRAHRLGLPKRPSHPNFTKPRSPKPSKPIIWTLHNIGPDQCRFPLGKASERAKEFCGAPARDGGSWCVEHHDIVFQKPINIGEKLRPENLGANVK